MATGIPPNRTLDINVGNNNANNVKNDILKNGRKWFKRNNIMFAFIWCFETGRTIGDHIHMIIHCPTDEPWKKYKKHLGKTLQNYGIDPTA